MSAIKFHTHIVTCSKLLLTSLLNICTVYILLYFIVTNKCTIVLCSTRQNNTRVSSTKGLHMKPQTHSDCKRVCNIGMILFYFIATNKCTIVLFSTRQNNTRVTSTKGLNMQPQIHSDCKRYCNIGMILFYFIVKTTIF